MNLRIHPVAELFPRLPKDELRQMAESIRRKGLNYACVRQGDVLLDGRNRLEACKMAGVEPRFEEFKGDSPVEFIVESNVRRRHLTKGQNIALAVEIEPYFAEEARKNQGRRADLEENVPPSSGKRRQRGEQARDQAAAATGLSGKLVSAAKAIKEADPELFKQVIDGKISIAKAKKIVKAAQEKRDLEAAQKTVEAAKRKHIESICDLRVCSCADLFKSGIRPDAVITDPPYPEEFLPCFTELAIGCKSAAVPLVAVMSGHSYLPEVLRRLCEHLHYRWTLAYLLPGGQAAQQWQAKVNTSWKPVLLFGEPTDWFGDVATSKTNDNDKRFHHWGQSESGMADLLNRLTKPGQLVCDPFLGGGTTAVVALALGRRFVGCDIEPANVEQAKQRVLA